MKKITILILVVSAILSGCIGGNVSKMEQSQQRPAMEAIINNQPIPDLGGYSFERQIVIETYYARNNTISTWAYMITMDGKIIEICPSIGYPIPYSTQLTNPDKAEYYSGGPVVVKNSEPNSLYPPSDAAATLIQCVNEDGSVTPIYNEWYVLAFPYRIKSDMQLEKISDSSFKVTIDK